MNSSVCVDASIILRTLVPGPFSDRAEALLADWQSSDIVLIAPSLFAYEVTSTLRRLVFLDVIAPAHGDEAFDAFLRLPIRLSHSRSIFPLTWEFAKELERPRAYDAAYLALAQLHDCPFWTADERLYNAVGDQLPRVHWVGAN